MKTSADLLSRSFLFHSPDGHWHASRRSRGPRVVPKGCLSRRQARYGSTSHGWSTSLATLRSSSTSARPQRWPSSSSTLQASYHHQDYQEAGEGQRRNGKGEGAERGPRSSWRPSSATARPPTSSSTAASYSPPSEERFPTRPLRPAAAVGSARTSPFSATSSASRPLPRCTTSSAASYADEAAGFASLGQ